MFIGIDLGTSSIKVILIDENQKIIGKATRSLELLNPQSGHYEQDPESWYTNTIECFGELKSKYQKQFIATQAIGISGQMHGSTLIDKNNIVLRPCILWNDTRSEKQCHDMEDAYPDLRKEAGNVAMPGFTAPKILWIKENEYEIYKKIWKVLLPKDYLRYRLSGEYYTDMSDASGTLWLDVKNRKWSEKLLNLTDLNISHMHLLVEGNEATAFLSKEIKNMFGFNNNIIIAGGAGDQAAGAIGSGVINNSKFYYCGNDALDFSGSNIEINNIFISNVLDKGVSIGENSNVSGAEIQISNSRMGLVSKDMSFLNIQNVKIDSTEIAFSVFQKKSEFGPAKIEARYIQLQSCQNDYWVENGSELMIDNVLISPNMSDLSSIVYFED